MNTLSTEFLIYGLCDPRTQEIRYVGQSTRGMIRPAEHFPPSKKDTTYKAKWLRKLIKCGLGPITVILEQCVLREELSSREQYWIAIGRAALGKRFTNATAGGDGCLDPTPETRAKMSIAISATKNLPDVKARISETSKEVSSRPEVRQKKSVGMIEAWKRPGYADSHNTALKAALNLPGVQDKHSISAKAAHARPDVKERHRAALKAAALRPEILAKRAIGRNEAYSRPEVKERHRIAVKEALNKPEVKAKMSLASKAMWEKRKATPKTDRINVSKLARTLGVSRRYFAKLLSDGLSVDEAVSRMSRYTVDNSNSRGPQ